jgi:Rod binding domain-containing protein
MYREMWLEKVAAQAAQSGDGIGIAKVVEREMRDKARHTFTPEQAALLQR